MPRITGEEAGLKQRLGRAAETESDNAATLRAVHVWRHQGSTMVTAPGSQSTMWRCSREAARILPLYGAKRGTHCLQWWPPLSSVVPNTVTVVRYAQPKNKVVLKVRPSGFCTVMEGSQWRPLPCRHTPRGDLVSRNR
ncbi:hypothetical protein NDU88_005029 [Pleurodeles waltl]|uniref:Uncharacterized protein n=1 Tax=Pleurodeles waltl TaxID=8319 RepID=A0AAV7TA36_PLEWA|nr:hypothetical protein NDU88_005029 [Pleurodeles waltl]